MNLSLFVAYRNQRNQRNQNAKATRNHNAALLREFYKMNNSGGGSR